MLPLPRPGQSAQLCLLGVDSCWPFAHLVHLTGVAPKVFQTEPFLAISHTRAHPFP